MDCYSSTTCTAVGQYWNGTKWGASGNEWNGTSWAVASVVPNVGSGSGDKNGNLYSVSCFSAARCFASGAYGQGGVGKTLVEASNKGAWTFVSPPNPAGQIPELFGISCTSLEFCVSTGRYVEILGPGATLAEEWEGAAWSLLSPVKNPGNRDNGHLWSVSCYEEGACIAAGGWGRENLEGRVIGQAGSQIWNRLTNKWTAIEAPEPPTAKFGDFYGISCISATFCMAAGRWSENISSGPYQAFADVWDGSKWSVVLFSGGPPGATEATFNSVSCVSTEECMAVGYAISSGVKVTLAYRWKAGKWEFQSTPNPVGAISSELKGVSCTASEKCFAVGGYRNSSNQLKPFALHLE